MLLKKEWGVSVERPIEEVFASYVDRFGEVWGLGEMEVLTHGAISAGTRFSPVGDPRWGDPSALIEVDRYDPPGLLAFAGSRVGAHEVPFCSGWREGRYRPELLICVEDPKPVRCQLR